MAYGFYASITVDNTKVGGTADFTDFPVLVSGIYDGTGGEPDIRSAANGGKVQNVDTTATISGVDNAPADLAFYDDSSATTQYDHEVIKYVPTTGELVAYVRIPTLLYASATTFYMHYGDASVTTSQENIGGTWNANYKGVWHLEGASKDSSGNVHDGTDTNVSYGTTNGKVVQGGISAGGLGDGINVGNHADFNFTTQDFSAVFWVKFTNGDSNKLLICRGVYESDGWYLQQQISATKYRFLIYCLNVTWSGTYTNYSYDGGVWLRVVMAKSGTTAKFYVNGAEATYSLQNSMKNPATSVRNLYLMRYEGTGNELRDAMDEVYILQENLTLGWALTDYNNQNDPATFYTMGSETAAGGGAVGGIITPLYLRSLA